MNKLKDSKYIILLILFISIGFAILTANLNINGQVSFKDSVWDVHFENIVVEEDSVEAEKPTITDKTEVSFNVSLSRPGDYYEFYVDVVNAGTMDATLNEINKTELIDQYAEKLNYNVTYYSDSPIQNGDLLRAGLKQRIKVRVEYKYDLEEYTRLDDLSLSLNLTYQKTDIQSASYNKNVWDIDFTGTEEILNISKSGTYKLEVWGSQGGISPSNIEGSGGYGGYSVGEVDLTENQQLYINVGGQGTSGNKNYAVSSYRGIGGYNGGGHGGKGVYYIPRRSYFISGSGGGGATHIATSSGLLSEFEEKQTDLLIVAGGGGGFGYNNSIIPGSGGGFKGVPDDNHLAKSSDYCISLYHISVGGTQTDGYKFGIGQNGRDSTYAASCNAEGNGGSGGGYYGGKAVTQITDCSYAAGSGGSGYIGNSLLKNKSMYCYNCEQSSDTNTKTITTTNVSEIPTSNYAKKGNGYARITYLG